MPPVSSNADSIPSIAAESSIAACLTGAWIAGWLSLQAGNDSAAAKWLYVAARSADTLVAGS